MKEKNEIVEEWSMRKGYIAKDPYGNIHIVTGTRPGHNGRPLVEWIAFDSSNCSGSTPVFPEDHKAECPCHFDNWVGEGEEAHTVPEDDCKLCKGTGEYVKHEYGAVDWKILASNAKDYITELFKKALKEIEK
jgi:hypothetical protein